VRGAFLSTQRGAVFPPGGASMIDPSSKVASDLKAAEEFFQLAKNASSPFMRAYYRRVGERYLSSQGELKPARRPTDVPVAERPAIRT
jgi:hypothetical protein